MIAKRFLCQIVVAISSRSNQSFAFAAGEGKSPWKQFQSPRLLRKKQSKSNDMEDNEETHEEDATQAEGKRETSTEKTLRKEKEKKLLKEYESYKKLRDETVNDVPPNLVIKNLHYPSTKTDVILLGVERRNNMHASFVHDCMENLKPDVVTTQIPCDMPYFIRTKIAYEEAWGRFIRGKFDYKFYVNPNPISIYDIMLNSESIRQLMSGGILNSHEKFELGSLFVYTPNHISKQFNVDAMLTPLLYLYNNPHIHCNLIVNDYPIIKYRDNINRLIKIDELKSIYEQYKTVLEQQGPTTLFDPLLLKPELFIHPKTAYITESIRNACYSNRKVLAVVDRYSADYIEEYWKTMPKEPQNLSMFLKDEYFSKSLQAKQEQIQDDQDQILTDEGLKFKNEINQPELETYIEYVEKHVILDLMIDPFIRDYFVKNKIFPYQGKQYIGHKSMIQQIFVMLEHFYHQHSKDLKEIEPHSYEERMVHATPNEFIKKEDPNDDKNKKQNTQTNSK